MADDGQANARRRDVELVDREAELAALEAVFASCLAERRSRLVEIVGEAGGVGKSRLVAEFVRSAASGSTVLSGRCLSYGEGITYWPLAEAVKEAAAVDASDTPDQARARIAELAAAGPDGEAVAGLLAVAAGLSEARASPEEIAWATRKLLAALARERPVIFLLDDLQWAEPTFLALVDALAGVEAPVLLLALARSELPQLDGHDETVVIRLEPLPADASAALIDRTLAGGLPRDLRDHVIEAAGGNPLFLEELLAMLIDSGVVRRSDGGWISAVDESGVPLPPTLEALLESRLDLLDEVEREVMERGSVEGKVFRFETIEALSVPGELERLRAALDALADKGLVHHTIHAGEPAFLFRHLLVRDVVYRGIPKRLRAELHERFAGWLEEQPAKGRPRSPRSSATTSSRRTSTGEELGALGPEGDAIAQRAAARLEEAGFRALAEERSLRGDQPPATRGRASSGRGPRPRAAPPGARGGAHRGGTAHRAAEILAEARRLTGAAGDERLEARAQIEELVLLLQVEAGKAMVEAREAGVRARRTFEEAGTSSGSVASPIFRVRCIGSEGRAAAAEEAWERAASHARRAGDQRRLADILRWIPSAVLFGPTPAPAGIRRCEEIRRLLRGDLRAQSEILPAMGGLYAMTGRFEPARQLLAESDAILEELGFTIHSAPEWAAFIALLAGDPATAEGALRAGYERLTAMGESQLLSTTAALLARAIYEQGRYEEAYEFTEASASAAAVEDVVTQIGWRAIRARILASQGRIDEGEKLAREAVPRRADGSPLGSRRRSSTWRRSSAIVLPRGSRGRRAAVAQPLERKGESRRG